MIELTEKLARVVAAAVLLAGILLPSDLAFAITAGRACTPLDPLCNVNLPNYEEGNVDAGNSLDSPRVVVGGPFSGIDGRVGGNDTSDVFAFMFAGGPFVVQVQCDGCTADQKIVAVLYDAAKKLLGQASNGSLDPTMSVDLSFNSLAAGDYLLEVSVAAAADPLYTISFENGVQLFSINGIPEPAMLALVGLGLLGLGISRRKQA